MDYQAKHSEKTNDDAENKPLHLKGIIGAVLFLILAGALFLYTNLVVDFKGTKQDRGMYNAFYDLSDDYIDVACIGSSATSRYFNNSKAYHDEGIATFTFGSPSTPVMFYDDIIEECMTTQEPKLYVIELRNLCKGENAINEQSARFTIGGLKLTSPNRKAMVDEYLEYAEKLDETGSFNDSAINYYIPILRYHDRVLDFDLKVDDFLLKQPYNYMQGFYTSRASVTQAPQETPKYSSEIGEIDETSAKLLDSLLGYCDKIDEQVLFVLSPFSLQTYEDSENVNAIEKYVEDRGYECLNFNTAEMAEMLGIDWETDLYNRNHLNYLGSEKYTAFFARYLKENYGLEDHRGDPLYDDIYENGFKKYEKFVAKGIKYRSDSDVAG